MLRVDCPPLYPPGCKIVYVGEAPWVEECKVKEGFVGRAGRLLDKINLIGGLPREQIGLTNVAKRTPDDTFTDPDFKKAFYIREKVGRKLVTRPSPELLEWYKVLALELKEARPNVVVACGDEALQALCGLRGITNYRGSILPSSLVPGLKVIPLLHPSYILRKALWQELYISGWIVRDKVVPQSLFPEIHYEPWTEFVDPSRDELERLGAELTRQQCPWSLDIETDRKTKITHVGFAWGELGEETAVCMPTYELPPDDWFWRWLQGLINNNPFITGHNFFYDMAWLQMYGVKVPCVWMDSMIAFHRLYPELPKKLAFASMLFTDIPWYKGEGKDWTKKARYNIKDCVAQIRVVHRVLKEFEKHPQFSELYWDYTAECLPWAFEMQSNGMEVNGAGWLTAKNAVQDELNQVRAKLHELTQGELTVLKGNKTITDKQVMAFCYKTLGLPPKTKRGTGKLTADEDALVELLIKHPEHHILKYIIADRKLTKARDSYIEISYDEA